jgi:transposase
VEVVLFGYRAEILWRDLPERFDDFRVVQTRFSRWARCGVWKMFFQHLAADTGNEYAMIDSTIVRATSPAPGAENRGCDQAIGRGAGGECPVRQRRLKRFYQLLRIE